MFLKVAVGHIDQHRQMPMTKLSYLRTSTTKFYWRSGKIRSGSVSPTHIPAQAGTYNDMATYQLSDTTKYTENTSPEWVVSVQQQQYDSAQADYKLKQG